MQETVELYQLVAETYSCRDKLCEYFWHVKTLLDTLLEVMLRGVHSNTTNSLANDLSLVQQPAEHLLRIKELLLHMAAHNMTLIEGYHFTDASQVDDSEQPAMSERDKAKQVLEQDRKLYGGQVLHITKEKVQAEYLKAKACVLSLPHIWDSGQNPASVQ